MDQIGSILREARLAQGITFEQAEEEIMIKKRYLEALENEEWSKLPGRVYAKGFLRSYARFLGISEQAIVERFEVDVNLAQTSSDSPVAKNLIREPRRSIELNNKPKKKMIFILCILSILLLVGAQWVYKTHDQNSGVKHEAGTDSDIAQEPNQIPTVPTVPEVPKPNPPEIPKDTIDIMVLAQEEACWMRLKDGDKEIYEGTLKPGQKVEFSDLSQLYISVGNAGAIQVSINGVILDAFGDFGKVAKKNFRIENGILMETD